MSEEIPRWAQELTTKVDALAEQVGKNCTKLDGMDTKLDSIVEIVTANGQGIEVLSQRLDKGNL